MSKRKSKTLSSEFSRALKQPSFQIDTGVMGAYLPTRAKPLFTALQVLCKLPYRLMRPSARVKFSPRVSENTFVLTNIPSDTSCRVLDLGGATSLIPVQLASIGYRVDVADMRDYEFTHHNIKSVKGNILDTLGEARDEYDAISALSSIEHAGMPGYVGADADPDEDLKIMRLFKQLLRPGGRVLLTVPYGDPSTGTSRHRVYDKDRLQLLTKPFKTTKALYVRPTRHGTITPCDAKDLEHSRGNACLVLTHPSHRS